MAGNFTPISFIFVAAGLATQARISLGKFQPSRTGDAPSWEGRGGEMATGSLTPPITDRSYWEGRYVLTELTFKKADGEELVMNDAVVSLSRSKNIVKTALVGLDGTIKEYICNGDYNITINVGIVAVDQAGHITDDYPEEGMRTVRRFLDENQQVKVSSVFLNIFDVTTIVVESFSLRQDTHSNRQSVEIKALSDEDYVIKSEEY